MLWYVGSLSSTSLPLLVPLDQASESMLDAAALVALPADAVALSDAAVADKAAALACAVASCTWPIMLSA